MWIFQKQIRPSVVVFFQYSFKDNLQTRFFKKIFFQRQFRNLNFKKHIFPRTPNVNIFEKYFFFHGKFTNLFFLNIFLMAIYKCVVLNIFSRTPNVDLKFFKDILNEFKKKNS